MGIVIELVPDEDLERATAALANELCQFAPLAQRTAKRLLNETEDMLFRAIQRKGIAILDFVSPMTFVRASRLFTKSELLYLRELVSKGAHTLS